jgi:Zn-finger nucleic acid-binding protein
MSAQDAMHCAGCGRDLGLEPIPRDGTLPCPDCHGAMSVLECGPGAVHDCGRCGGQFVEVGALRELLERHSVESGVESGVDAGVAGARVTVGARVAPVRYVACPVCRGLMNRRNFGHASGVIVDVCAKHGTWFDRGELPRVLAFVESGGLTREREREALEHQRTVRERSDRAAETASIPTFANRADVDRLSTSLVGEFLAALFGE